MRLPLLAKEQAATNLYNAGCVLKHKEMLGILMYIEQGLEARRPQSLSVNLPTTFFHNSIPPFIVVVTLRLAVRSGMSDL
jgi:hypothetical protein